MQMYNTKRILLGSWNYSPIYFPFLCSLKVSWLLSPTTFRCHS